MRPSACGRLDATATAEGEASVMRKLALVLIAMAGLAWAAPSSARPSPTGHSADYVCGDVSKNLTYLFWPKGHPGLPSVLPFGEFMPDLSRAHVSVYRVGSDYLDSNWLLTIQILPVTPAEPGSEIATTYRRSPSATTKPCTTSHGAKWKFKMAHVKTRRKATALTCKFRSKYGYIGWGGSNSDVRHGRMKIRAHDKETVFFEAKTDGVPKLRYDTSFCKRIPLPK
jgi:hypothetical protein